MHPLPPEHHQDLDRCVETYWWHRHRIATVAAQAEKFLPRGREGLCYMDIGGGSGAATLAVAGTLERRGRLRIDPEHVICVDADPALAALQAGKPIHFVKADLDRAETLDLAGVRLFTLLDVLEHLERPDRLLSELHAGLPSGAVGVITAPAYSGLFSDWDRRLGHYRRYRRRALRRDCQQAGFKVLSATYLFAFAFPVAWILRKACATARTAEFPKIPGWLNRLLAWAGACERAILKISPLPFGTSVLVVIQK